MNDLLPRMKGRHETAELEVAARVVHTRPLIQWRYLIERRAAVLAHTEDLPEYLLLPEVHALIAGADKSNHRLLIATLWNTGARISEALALTRASFTLDAPNAYVSLRTLKKRGRPKQSAKRVSRVPMRMVPISNAAYLDQVRRYLADTPLKSDERIFKFTRQAADQRVRVLMERHNAQARGRAARISIPVSCHTFRHSFAVNCILHGTPLPVLQGWLGHANIQSTVVYTQVLTAETGHLMAAVEW